MEEIKGLERDGSGWNVPWKNSPNERFGEVCRLDPELEEVIGMLGC